MLYVLWSAKGGSGTTVAAAMLGSALSPPPGVLLVDLAGDLPRALGAPEPPVGVVGLLGSLASLDPSTRAGDARDERVPGLEELRTVEVEAAAGVGLIGRGGDDAFDPAGADRLLDLLAREPRPVVVDAGTLGRGARAETEEVAGRFLHRADSRLLVIRPCYLGLRAATTALSSRPADGCILITERERALKAPDVASVLGVPVVAEVPVSSRVARTVDAGLLLHRRDELSARELAGVLAGAT